MYDKIIVSRAVMPIGKELGFLPGKEDVKFYPWIQPFWDAAGFMEMKLEKKAKKNTVIKEDYNEERDWERKYSKPLRFEGSRKAKKGKIAKKNKKDADEKVLNEGDVVKTLNEKVKAYFSENGCIGAEPITYIRGRTFTGRIMIIDEAQNMTPSDIKTIVTRAGQGTKIILMGDPSQIDNPYLDSENNGLTYVVDRMKGAATFGHITLIKTVRSGLAALAAERL